MRAAVTLPRLLHRNSASFGRRPALREKRGGIWQVLSWSDYAALVSRLAVGLAAEGFARDDKLAVIGDNRPSLYAALLAAQSLGGAGVPLWADAEPDWIEQVLRHAGVSVVVAEDAEQVDKIAAIRDRLPDLRLVVQTTSHGMRQGEGSWLRSLDTLAAVGTASIEQSEPGDLALLLYGTTTAGDVRGVMLSHANLLAAAEALIAVEDVRPNDETLAWLPMAWFGDVLTSTLALAVGFTCNCPESPETVRRDLREIGPTILLAPPGVWENVRGDIEARAAQATPLKRALFERFRAIAERVEQHRTAGASIPLALRLKLTLGEALIYAPMRDQIGLSRLRWANTGGEPLAPDVLRFFRAVGVNLKQSYGMAELGGIAIVQDAVCTGVELAVAEDGEVLVGGASVCIGYYRDPERTHRSRAENGMWRTGDAGSLDVQGRLTLHDRIAHLGVLADGTRFAARTIEHALRRSPFIRNAIVLGHDQGFVAAVIVIDPIAVGAWAQRQRFTRASPADLAAAPEVRELIRGEIRACNAALPVSTRIRRFLLLERTPAIAGIEVSLSRELSRHMALADNVAVVQSLFLEGTAVTDEIVAAIEEVGEAAWEPAHA